MKILGHNYKVRIVPHLRGFDIETETYSGKEVYGQTNYDKGLMEVSSLSSKGLQEETLIHEVLHAIMFHSYSRKDHDESLIQAISNGLYRLGVGKYLMKKANGGREK